MVPFEAFLAGEAGRDDDGRGRAARRRPRARDRPRRRADRGRESRPRSRSARTTHARGARPARRWPSRSPGTARSTGCSREGRLLLARCRPRGRGSPTTARCCCPSSQRADRRRRRAPGPLPPRAASRRLALPHRQRPRGARLDRPRARGAARRRRPARVRPPPPRRRADARRAATRAATSTRWSAGTASPDGCSPTG